MSEQARAIVLVLVRHGITAFGVWLAAGGVTLTGTQLDTLAGIVVALISVGAARVIEVWQARKARAATVAAAVASAEQTAKATQEANRPVLVPVTVTVTPAGQENEAVRVSAAEARAAPSVPADAKPRPAPLAAAA